jgi:uncharacterized protein YegP (UPF0339 family)
MAKFEIFRDVRGEYRWRLRSRNGEIFAVGGEGFEHRSAVENGIAAVKREAAAAAVVDKTDSPVTALRSEPGLRIEPGMAKKKLPPPM